MRAAPGTRPLLVGQLRDVDPECLDEKTLVENHSLFFFLAWLGQVQVKTLLVVQVAEADEKM